MINMKTSLKGLIEIAGHEGICLSKYRDSVGVWTIAVGATASEIPNISSWPIDKTITIKEAFELFNKSIVKYEMAVNKGLIREIPQYQFDALVSWCYNVGVGWVKKATVVQMINSGDASDRQLYNALLMFSKPKEIVGRRTKEALLLTTGKYQNRGKALVFPVGPKGNPVYSRGKEINVEEYLTNE